MPLTMVILKAVIKKLIMIAIRVAAKAIGDRLVKSLSDRAPRAMLPRIEPTSNNVSTFADSVFVYYF